MGKNDYKYKEYLSAIVRHYYTIDLPVGSRQTTYRETSLGSLSPALLMAVTLNW